MTAEIINGTQVAEATLNDIRNKIGELGSQPGLVVVRVGDDPASEIYVNKKVKKAAELGINSEKIQLPTDVSEDELLDIVDDLNIRNDVHGILVQLPLPKHISAMRVIETISPHKDVDGFHPINVGWLSIGKPRFVSCTPKGIMKLIASVESNISGKQAVVVGRSNIVGKPMSMLLLNANCTVTTCHSRTKDLASHTKEADILISAVGKAGLITKDHVKPGQIVIDVGMNRLEDGSLAGDVAFDEVSEIVAHITPVPGGVGPMTIACLMENTLESYLKSY